MSFFAGPHITLDLMASLLPNKPVFKPVIRSEARSQIQSNLDILLIGFKKLNYGSSVCQLDSRIGVGIQMRVSQGHYKL